MTDLLEQRLGQLAERLDVAEDDRLVAGVLAAIDTGTAPSPSTRRSDGRVRRPALIAAAAALLGVVLVPASRHAIAGWLGIGSTRIEQVPFDSHVEATFPPAPTPTAPTPTVPTPTVAASTEPAASPPPVSTMPTTVASADAVGAALGLGDPVSMDDAASAAGLPVPSAPGLGEPIGVYVVTPPSTGQIVAVHPPSPRLPATPVAGVGALLATSPGTVDEGSFVKMTGPGSTLTTVHFTTATGERVEAFWLAGEPHAYGFTDADGMFVIDTLRLATNTLLWVVDGVQFRLESGLELDAALEIASTVVTSAGEG